MKNPSLSTGVEKCPACPQYSDMLNQAAAVLGCQGAEIDDLFSRGTMLAISEAEAYGVQDESNYPTLEEYQYEKMALVQVRFYAATYQFALLKRQDGGVELFSFSQNEKGVVLSPSNAQDLFEKIPVNRGDLAGGFRAHYEDVL